VVQYLPSKHKALEKEKEKAKETQKPEANWLRNPVLHRGWGQEALEDVGNQLAQGTSMLEHIKTLCQHQIYSQ
jgi:hypothetical protein